MRARELEGMTRLASRLARFAERSAGRPAYPALVGAVAAVDYFLPGAPTNAVLVAAVLPRPARWRTLGVAFALGDAVGATLLAAAIVLVGDPVAAWIEGGEAAGVWAQIGEYVAAYGLLTLAALAVTPLPARIVTAALALAGTPPLVIGTVVLAGRLVAYPAVAYVAARAPGALSRFRPFIQTRRPMILSGRSVLVTGATSGVGNALARALAARGAHVVVHGRDAGRLAAVAADVGGTAVAADLAAADGPAILVRAALAARPDLSVLVTNAAVQQTYLFAERDADAAARDAAREVAVDLTAPIQTTALLLGALREAAARSGEPSVVVNVTSGLALAPKKTAAVYCAAKAGLRTFTKALRYQADDEAAAGGPHVRVVEAMLPLVDTPMTAGRKTRVAKMDPDAAASEIVRGIERGRPVIGVGKAGFFARLHRWAPGVTERMLRDG